MPNRRTGTEDVDSDGAHIYGEIEGMGLWIIGLVR